MKLFAKVLGKSPFGSIVAHTKKANACVRLIRPLIEACIREDYEEVHRLQDTISKLEYEADTLKHTIREGLPRQYILPVEKADLSRFLHSQDRIADLAEDFAVMLLIRKTRIHPDLVQEFYEFVDQVLVVSDMLMTAAIDMEDLVEVSFRGAEAKIILQKVSGLNEAEWKADRMQRRLSQHVYDLENEIDPVTIFFYEKMMRALSSIANAAENTGEILRQMIIKA
jgi:predicted phosphate transport protein (TIGR00153 family)